MPRLCLLIQVKQHSKDYFISSIFFWVRWHRSNWMGFLLKIWREQELNPWPIGHELTLLTTRPPPRPVLISYYGEFPWTTKRTTNLFNLLCQRNPLCIFLLCISNVTLKFPLSIFDQFFFQVLKGWRRNLSKVFLPPLVDNRKFSLGHWKRVDGVSSCVSVCVCARESECVWVRACACEGVYTQAHR